MHPLYDFPTEAQKKEHKESITASKQRERDNAINTDFDTKIKLAREEGKTYLVQGLTRERNVQLRKDKQSEADYLTTE